MTLTEMQALLAALLGMRFGGVRSITYDGRQISVGMLCETCSGCQHAPCALSIMILVAKGGKRYFAFD